ncbi:MAG: hypothetical protein ACI9OJ_002440 [Myxococcota bacterium]|jgi:hypothetical protein
MMDFKELESVVLDRDLPEHRLRRGDLGAIVHVHTPDAFEVEFVSASGHTEALVTLRASDLRRLEDSDLITVRTLRRSA